MPGKLPSLPPQVNHIPVEPMPLGEADRMRSDTDPPRLAFDCAGYRPPGWLHGGPHLTDKYYAFGFDAPQYSVVVHARVGRVRDFLQRHPGEDQRSFMLELHTQLQAKSELRQWFDIARRKPALAYLRDKSAPKPAWRRVRLAELRADDMLRMEEVGQHQPFPPSFPLPWSQHAELDGRELSPEQAQAFKSASVAS